MDRKEELLKVIADAEEELNTLEPEENEIATEANIQSMSDYTYWQGKSRIIVDILNAEVHPAIPNERRKREKQGRMYEVELSHSEMESSQEMDLRIVRFWKQEPVIEGGLVTHFRKVDIVEKRYSWNWELING